MAALPDPTSRQLGELRERLVRHAARGGVRIPESDREDVAQDALLKLVGEHRSDTAPALEVRGFAALKQAKVDYVRRRTRAKEPVLELLEENEEVAAADAQVRLIELEQTLIAEFDENVLRFARMKQAGMTEAEIGEAPGWTPQQAGAARRRLQRGLSGLREQLLDD